MPPVNNQEPALAIIPARGGSKRIPKKNIKEFAGLPIIAWSIKAAQASKQFSRIMVSTDCPQIAAVARSYGAEVPFLRSEANSSDVSPVADALLEVLEDYARRGQDFAVACCLHATAPFILPQDLMQGRQALEAGGYDTMMPVAAFDYPIWRSLKRDNAGRLALNFPENLNKRSQDLPTAYHDAGQWYWFRTDALKRDRAFLGPNTGSIILSSVQVQDIDTEADWALAELKHQHLFGESC